MDHHDDRQVGLKVAEQVKHCEAALARKRLDRIPGPILPGQYREGEVRCVCVDWFPLLVENISGAALELQLIAVHVYVGGERQIGVG